MQSLKAAAPKRRSRAGHEPLRRRLLDTLTRFVAWTRRRQLHTPKGEPVNVNLGSGLTVAPGWINIDSSLNALASTLPRPLMGIPYRFSNAPRWYTFPEYTTLLKGHVFVHHDLAFGIPLPDASADCIYSSHSVEHLSRGDAERLLREAERVLKAGGVMRLVVPDFERVLKAGGVMRLVVPDFERFVTAYRAGESEAIIDALFGETDDLGWYSRHRYAYDFDLLSRMLHEAGFTDVVRCEHGSGSVPDLETFEGDRPSRYLLVVEATKTSRQAAAARGPARPRAGAR